MTNKELKQTVKSNWNKEKQHNAELHVIYNILRGKDASAGFTPVKENTNKARNNNGDLYNAFNRVVSGLRFSLSTAKKTGYQVHYENAFGIEFSSELVEKLRNIDFKK